MTLSIIWLIAGFGFLIQGAEWLVRGASSFAKRLKVPEIVIGLTVVAMGTSTPELVVNIIASAKGAADIAFGNVIGSNNFNVLMILGLCATFFPLVVKRATTWKEIPFAVVISVLFLFMMNDHWFRPGAVDMLSKWDAVALLIMFGLFLVYTFRLARTGEVEASEVKVYSMLLSVLAIAGGFAGLIAGGDLVVKHAVIIAQGFGISEKVIGLTIVAAGTSLPELATSFVAALRKHPDLAVGNIVGSNIFNLLFILGISGMIRPLKYSPAFNMDTYLMIGCMALLFVMLMLPRRHRLERWQGAVMVALYVAYVIYLIKGSGA